jgi:hypothetical protein
MVFAVRSASASYSSTNVRTRNISGDRVDAFGTGASHHVESHIMADYKTSDRGRSAGLHLDRSFSVSDERKTRPGQLRE